MSSVKRSESGPFTLDSTFLRLRHDASVEPLHVDETFWQRLASGRLGSFHREYLVTLLPCARDWSTWEMHPHGDEIVCLLSGRVTMILEESAGPRALALAASGACVVVPRGTWHTAKVHEPARMLFITPGEGTQHRPLGA